LVHFKLTRLSCANATAAAALFLRVFNYIFLATAFFTIALAAIRADTVFAVTFAALVAGFDAAFTGALGTVFAGAIGALAATAFLTFRAVFAFFADFGFFSGTYGVGRNRSRNKES